MGHQSQNLGSLFGFPLDRGGNRTIEILGTDMSDKVPPTFSGVLAECESSRMG
jgi:hypothetical protein